MTVRRPLVLVNGQLKELPDGDPLLQALSYPADRPALLLDFVNSQRVDPRLTFSRSSVGTYLDRAGVLRTAAVNAPRLDFDPVTGVCRGLLMEPQRTNLYYPCKRITAGLGATFTANAAASLDGTLTAGKLIATATNGPHEGAFNFPWTAGLVYTVSFDVWPTSANIHGVWGTASSTVGGVGGFSYSFVTKTGTGAVFRPLPGGGVRVEDTFTPTTTAAANFFITPQVSGSSTFAGDGVNGLMLDYIQVEQAATASSRIYTSTGQVTRAADACSIGGAAFAAVWNASAGTALLDTAVSAASAVDLQYLAMVDQDARFLFLPINSLAVNTYDGSKVVVGSEVTGGVPFKASAAFGPAGLTQCVNAGTVASDTFDGTFGNNPTALNIGSPGAPATTTMQGYIRRVAYWPRQLSNSELQAVTT